MVSGVLVSRSSPGPVSLSSGSRRSSRVTGSSSVRTNAVVAAGPPSRPVSRFAAVLSLTTIAASHSAATVMPVSTKRVVVGA